MEITLVKQEYESTESWQDYKIGIKTTYRGRGTPMNIRKARENLNKDERLKYFNCNAYRYMAKEYWKLKKKQDTRKYYRYDKLEHIAKNCRSG